MTVAPDPEVPERYVTVVAEVHDGFFRAQVEGDDWRVVRAEYLPPVGFGPSRTDWAERG